MLDDVLDSLLSAEPEQKRCPVARFLDSLDDAATAAKFTAILESADIPAESITDAIVPWAKIAPTTIRRHRRWMAGASNGCNCTPQQEIDPEL